MATFIGPSSMCKTNVGAGSSWPYSVEAGENCSRPLPVRVFRTLSRAFSCRHEAPLGTGRFLFSSRFRFACAPEDSDTSAS